MYFAGKPKQSPSIGPMSRGDCFGLQSNHVNLPWLTASQVIKRLTDYYCEDPFWSPIDNLAAVLYPTNSLQNNPNGDASYRVSIDQSHELHSEIQQDHNPYLLLSMPRSPNTYCMEAHYYPSIHAQASVYLLNSLHKSG